MIQLIFERQTNVRAAIRMASSEVERISALKQKVSQAYEEVQAQRDKEEKHRDQIIELKSEIGYLKIKKEENIELGEEEILK